MFLGVAHSRKGEGIKLERLDAQLPLGAGMTCLFPLADYNVTVITTKHMTRHTSKRDVVQVFVQRFAADFAADSLRSDPRCMCMYC